MMSDHEIMVRLIDRLEKAEAKISSHRKDMNAMTSLLQEHRARIQALEKTIEQWEKR